MTQNSKFTVLGIAASIVIIAGGFYIAHLRGQLADAERQSAGAQEAVQKLDTTLNQTHASLAAASEAQQDLETRLAQSNAKVADLSTARDQQLEALKQEVSNLRANLGHRRKVSSWWRELFDYTKPFDGPVAEDAQS